ncbi:alpha/beta hydrolase [Neorhizobium sp. BT27B]|uniref:alpha/beta fold hydrolase n=1 Tax=Neorhizobium sp. BT27B TaxID=3142625 RepID=UPI003D281FFE
MTDTASTAPTQFADLHDRKIAYRKFGSGTPIVLNVRFRGTMDSWDPLFLDELSKDFEVIVYDYSGLGASTGNASYDRASLVKDAKDLIDFLGFETAVIGGWSLGGVVAQKFTATHPDLVSHTVLIGTAPPGTPEKSGERLFMETAMHPNNGLEDQTILFFEPTSDRSREAAKRSLDRIESRQADRSPQIPESVFMKLLSEAKDRTTIYPDPDGAEAKLLESGIRPIFVISGDHDIACPVENWLSLTTKWRSLHLLTIPQAGHGPHHQEPVFCAKTIRAFIKSHTVKAL